jgi:hypothetical protein
LKQNGFFSVEKMSDNVLWKKGYPDYKSKTTKISLSSALHFMVEGGSKTFLGSPKKTLLPKKRKSEVE